VRCFLRTRVTCHQRLVCIKGFEEKPRNSEAMYESVDEFLARYRHDPQTIYEFIRCLDGFSTYHSKKECCHEESKDHKQTNAPCPYEPPELSCNSDSDIDADGERKQISLLWKNNMTQLKCERTIKSKRRKASFSTEEMTERRRIQNRQAQQRAREKKLLTLAQRGGFMNLGRQSCISDAPHFPALAN
jgi:hypothetical protein